MGPVPDNMRSLIRFVIFFCLNLAASSGAQTYDRHIDLALLDYDNTIEPTKTKLSFRSAEHFHAMFKRGVEIAVISMQHRERIESCLVKPLIEFLNEQKADLSLLDQLHVFSSGGQEYYQVKQLGLEGPIYRLGLTDKKRAALTSVAKAKQTVSVSLTAIPSCPLR